MERKVSGALCGLVFASVLTPLAGGCGGAPDPRTIEGVTAYAMQALEHGDAARLFRVVDARSRHAMISIVADRHAARDAIRARYPASEQASALALLGDAAEARDAADLFARRCLEPCLGAFQDALGAPTETHPDGDELVVRTTRDAEVRLYRKRESDWWGLVWRTRELVAERDRANRDLAVILENAATYERRRALEAH